MGELSRRFHALSEQLSGLIEREGWGVLPYKMLSLPFFRQLTTDQKQLVVRQLADYISICERVQADGLSIKNSLFLVKKALQHYSVHVHDDVMKLIQDRYVVEFYNMNHLQMFRTFNFFEFTSYTIEDIYCRPWYSLFDRDPHITEKLLSEGMPLLMSDFRGPSHLNVPAHYLTERDSLEGLMMLVKSTWVAPLFKGNEKIGFVNILDVESVEVSPPQLFN